MPALPSGVVTLLFTDIEGSTRLWETEPVGMRAALERHDRIVRDAAESAGGYVFKTVGDAFCVAFATAGAGLVAAVAAQRALAIEDWCDGVTIRVRMALHSGECTERDNDYFGPTVNRTARLEAIGHGGQLLLSGATADGLGPELPDGVSLRDLGQHRLKDLVAPERVFQVVLDGLRSDFPPVRSLGNATYRHNLPRYSTSFVGRATELREVLDLVAGGSLVTLTGPGGSGKTRLAVHVAVELLENQPDGVWLVELANVDDPAIVAATVASTLGIGGATSAHVEMALTDAIADRRMTLVLDNCEHVVDAAARLCAAVLSACPHVTLIATSREVLDLAGERVYRVAPLGLPRDAAEWVEVAGSDSVQLFAERAVAHRRDFVLCAENAPAVADVCRRLDGLPLALELAAAQTRSFSVAEIAELLGERFVLLSRARTDSVRRQQTLRAMVDWSYELLDAAERTLLARLSVFTGGWTLEAAAAVAGPPGLGEVDTAVLLRSLVDKSLVETTQTSEATTRYYLLETIRAYAADRLLELEIRDVHAAHGAFFLSLAETARPHLIRDDQVIWHDRLSVDDANLRAAIAQSCEAGDVDTALRLVVALEEHWFRRSLAATALPVASEAVELAAEPTDLFADALHCVGKLSEQVSDYRTADTYVARARDIALALADTERAARYSLTAIWNRSLVAGFDKDEAVTELEQITGITDDQTRAFLELTLGAVTSDFDHERARRHFRRALDFYELAHDPRGRGTTLTNLVGVELMDRCYEPARVYALEARSIFEAVKDPAGIAYTTCLLGLFAIMSSENDAALAHYREALEIGNQLGDRNLVSFSLLGIAHCLTTTAPDLAATLLGTADAITATVGARRDPSDEWLHDETTNRARDHLGDTAYQEHYRRGTTLPAAEAIRAAIS
jgi:predicted ATPase/class 3 adenylate cyclase